MNFLRNSFSTGSLRRRSATVTETRDQTAQARQADQDVCFETYERHWQQLEDTIKAHAVTEKKVTTDDCALIISSHLEHLLSFIGKELEKSKLIIGASACLDHFLKNDIIFKICIWSLRNQCDDLLVIVTEGIDSLLAAAKKGGKDLGLLRDLCINKPICLLFNRYQDIQDSGQFMPKKFETVLLSISYYVCVFIVREPSFLDKFYNVATTEQQPKFPLMTLLIQNLHKNGAEGQTSRDNLKLLMALAKEQQLLAHYIALQSDFCPVVATGLNAVYSNLPRLLPRYVEDAGMLSAMDIETMKEVGDFVTALEFCDSILETAPWLIVSQLLDFCYNGFLLPVLDSVLFQNTMREIFAATCYLTLMLRRIRHRGLIGIFVRFLLVYVREDVPIIEFLVQRISAQTQLRLATLHFFQALINLDCEDVLLVLAMQYLLPCGHVMLSQKGDILQETDTSCLWAAKYLSLVPAACSSRPLQKAALDANDGRISHENAHPTRIRSWSRVSNEGDRQFGQLAFTNNEKKTSGTSATNEWLPSESDCVRLRSYLNDSCSQIRTCVDGCRHWAYLYDGTNPPITEAIRMLHNQTDAHISSPGVNRCDSEDKEPVDKSICEDEYPTVDPTDVYFYCMQQLSSCLTEINSKSVSTNQAQNSNTSALPQGLLYEETSFFSQDVQDDLEFWSLMRDDELDCSPTVAPMVSQVDVELYQPTTPSIGPFLETLIRSVDGWLNNSIEVNLALCSILSRLAAYQQPLLRSLILNPYLILQPSIPSLGLSIATLKQRIDSALRVHDNCSALLSEARVVMRSRLPTITKFDGNVGTIGNKGTPGPKQRSSKFTGLFSSLVRKELVDVIKENGPEDVHGSANGNQTMRMEGIGNNDPIGSHVAVCAVLLEEWLHELAAICIGHAVYVSPFTIPRTHV